MQLRPLTLTLVGVGIAALALAAYATDKNAKCLPEDQKNTCDYYSSAYVSQTPCPKDTMGDACAAVKCIRCDRSSGGDELICYCIEVDDDKSKCDHPADPSEALSCGKQKRYDCRRVTEPGVSCRCPQGSLEGTGTPLPDDCKVWQCTPPAVP